MADGWIKLYRCLLDKSIWQCSTPEQKVILITLLLMANHEENEWEWQSKKFKCRPGQFITSLDGIAKECGKGISIKNIRTALEKFEKYEFLTNQSAKTGRLITVLNWGYYQDAQKETGKDSGKEVANKGQRGGKEVATNKNDNNDKKKYINSSSGYEQQAENLWHMYPLKVGKGKVIKKIPGLIKKYSCDELKRAIDRYKLYVEKQRANGFTGLKYQNGSTFFNSGYIDYLDKNYTNAEEKLQDINPWANMSS